MNCMITVVSCFILLVCLLLCDKVGGFQGVGWRKAVPPSALQAVSDAKAVHLHRIQTWFQGSYSNFAQAEADRLLGKPTASSGGHEWVTAEVSVHPSLANTLIASFRFTDSLAAAPFRFRLYQFYNEDDNNQYDVCMKLWKPNMQCLQTLRDCQFNVSKCLPLFDDCEELRGCDVGWKYHSGDIRKGDGSAAAGRWWRRLLSLFRPISRGGSSGYYRGVLLQGECRLRSQFNASEEIIVRDELFLTPRTLSINDRVYASNGTLLIGNRDHIPYLFDKVDIKEALSS